MPLPANLRLKACGMQLGSSSEKQRELDSIEMAACSNYLHLRPKDADESGGLFKL